MVKKFASRCWLRRSRGGGASSLESKPMLVVLCYGLGWDWGSSAPNFCEPLSIHSFIPSQPSLTPIIHESGDFIHYVLSWPQTPILSSRGHVMTL